MKDPSEGQLTIALNRSFQVFFTLGRYVINERTTTASWAVAVDPSCEVFVGVDRETGLDGR